MEIVFKVTDIKQAAIEFLQHIEGFKVVAFTGEMGAGKTTFIQAMCEVLGVTENISSPTYSIINQYATTTNKIIYHLDLYRLQNEMEAINAGVEDCLYSGAICFVEWPEKALNIFPLNTKFVTIAFENADNRKLTLID